MFVLRETVLTGTQLEQYSAARIIILVCYNLPSEFVNTISYLLQYSRNDTTLALLVRIISGTITMHTPNDSPDINMDTERYQNLIKTGIEYALRESMHSDTVIKKCYVDGTAPKDRKTYTHHFCLNIIKLLRWESSGRVPHMAVWSVSASAGAGAAALGGALGGRASALRERVPCEPAGRMQAHALAEVLDKLDFSGNKLPPPSVEVIIKVIQATVKYFFMCLHEEEIMDKLRGTQRACRLLRKLCLHSKLARAIALRDLLETAMFREEATFGSKNFIGNTTSAALDWANDDLLMHLNQKHEATFGSKNFIGNTTSAALDWANDDLLMHLNQKHGPITQLTQSHTSVFHAGIIGKGVRRVNADEQNEIPDILTTNNELLMGALMSCMDGNSGIVEGMTAVSLLLVELISPDVMYNGLPWPDEDFTKQVSIERELYMRAALEGCVVARAALRRAAQHRPALCLASALLRACAASALHRHRAADDRYCMSAEMRRERSALSELLATMSLGQLLPPPLCHMLQLAPALTSSELVQILRDCLWNYTRDNVPSPALFECDATGLHWRDPASCAPPPSYTDALRIIIQKRIARLGHLYPLMFLNLEKSLHWRAPASCAPPPSYTDALRIIIQKRIARLGHLYPLMFLNLEKSDSNLAYMKQK
ncbi:hypothetical protein JYU34_016717 [Plutella xylostella]|uniref:Integrator complex subunit 5 C-terminal domain-containing protein n=1 Tax=Plutella xylostella TaxID=51655 RepID=A0ABQ7Q492_PLUXY|nr:hypothetical protein JYU34_016717 [Plutella xylostella]